jgi:uncharacterized protein (TIGR03083 family)
MDSAVLLRHLARDHCDLRDAAASAALTTPVPSCPGWTLSDLVAHVATVYLHKVVVMRTGEWPAQWPPPGLSAEAPLALLGRAYGELRAEFAARSPAEPAPTWFGPDQSVGFWIRRMAQETVIHRIDAEIAAGLPVTPVPDDLATDGVDEVLRCVLAYQAGEYAEEFAALPGGHLAGPDGRDTITIMAGTGMAGTGMAGTGMAGTGMAGRTAWTVRPAPRAVLVADGAADGARVVIEGTPESVFRWLWGRADDNAVRISGELAWADYLRRMLTELTQ